MDPWAVDSQKHWFQATVRKNQLMRWKRQAWGSAEDECLRSVPKKNEAIAKNVISASIKGLLGVAAASIGHLPWAVTQKPWSHHEQLTGCTTTLEHCRKSTYCGSDQFHWQCWGDEQHKWSLIGFLLPGEHIARCWSHAQIKINQRRGPTVVQLGMNGTETMAWLKRRAYKLSNIAPCTSKSLWLQHVTAQAFWVGSIFDLKRRWIC